LNIDFEDDFKRERRDFIELSSVFPFLKSGFYDSLAKNNSSQTRRREKAAST
jgi:hypothetical protein